MLSIYCFILANCIGLLLSIQADDFAFRMSAELFGMLLENVDLFYMVLLFDFYSISN
jgi:hypothetical protein